MIKRVSIGVLGIAGFLALIVICSCKPTHTQEDLSAAQEQSRGISPRTEASGESIHPVPVVGRNPMTEVPSHSSGSEIDQVGQFVEGKSGNSEYVSDDSRVIPNPLEAAQAPMVKTAHPMQGKEMVGGIVHPNHTSPSRKTDGNAIVSGKKNESEVDGGSGVKTTSESPVAKDSGQTLPEEEPETENPSVLVWRHDAMDTNGVLTVSYTIDVDETVDLPNGLILSELIPPGWTIVNSSIQPHAVNEKTRIAKWLFMENQVVDLSFFYQAEAVADSASASDWQISSSWYAYRRPYDGKPLEFYTGAY